MSKNKHNKHNKKQAPQSKQQFVEKTNVPPVTEQPLPESTQTVSEQVPPTAEHVSAAPEIPEQLDYKDLYEKQSQSLLAMISKLHNAENELEKLKLSQNEERQKLIQKLEEKSKQAQGLVQEKVDQIQKDTAADIQKAKHKFATELLLSLLDPILLFESTVNNPPKDNPAISSYLQGYKMIIDMFQQRLDDLGVVELEVKVGDAFDENIMTAFDLVHSPKMQPNKVVKIVSKGFSYNKKIIKYVSVVVSK